MRINNHEHTDLQEYLGSYVTDSNGRDDEGGRGGGRGERTMGEGFSVLRQGLKEDGG